MHGNYFRFNQKRDFCALLRFDADGCDAVDAVTRVDLRPVFARLHAQQRCSHRSSLLSDILDVQLDSDHN